jgi:hypothetical protein
MAPSTAVGDDGHRLVRPVHREQRLDGAAGRALDQLPRIPASNVTLIASDPEILKLVAVQGDYAYGRGGCGRCRGG